MKKYCLLLIIGFVFRIAAGQNSIDSLYQVLNNQTLDSLIIETKINIAKYYLVHHTDSADKYLKQAFQRAKEVQSHSLFLEANLLLAKNYMNKNLLSEAESQFIRGIEKSKEYGYSKETVRHLIGLGLVHDKKGEFEKSIEVQLSALEYAEKEKDSVFIAAILQNLGGTFVTLNKNEKAIEYLSKARQIAQKFQLHENLANIYNDWGYAKYQLGDLDSALYFFEQTLAIKLTNTTDIQGQTMALHNIATIAVDKGYFKKALTNYKKIIELRRKGNIAEDVSMILSQIGLSYFRLQQQDSAYFYLKNALKEADISGFSQGKLNTLNYLILIDSTNGNYKDAMRWALEAKKVSENIFSEAKAKQVEEMIVKYESEKKERENVLLKTQNNVLIQERKTEKIFNYSLLFALVASCVIAILGFSLAKSRKFKLLQQEQIFELEKERTAEKEMLLHSQHAAQVAENKLLQTEIEVEKREVISKAIQLANQEKKLQTIQNRLKELTKENRDDADKNVALKKMIYELEKDINAKESWEVILLHFNKVFPNFFQQLRSNFSALTVTDEKLCAHIKLRLSNQEIANMLNVDVKSIFRSRLRLRDKLGLEHAQDIESYLINF